MNLKNFHILFVVLAEAVTITFGVWCLGAGRRIYPGTPMRLLGLLCLLFAAAVLVYGVSFLRKLAKLGVATLALMLAAHAAEACSVCMGDAEAPMTKGMVSGIIVLLVITGSLLAGFGTFFVCLVKRARAFGNTPAGPVS